MPVGDYLCYVLWGAAVCLAGLKGATKEQLTSSKTSISLVTNSKDPEAKQSDEVSVGSLTSDFVVVDNSDMKRPTDADEDDEVMPSGDRKADLTDDGNDESDLKSDVMVSSANPANAQRDPDASNL